MKKIDNSKGTIFYGMHFYPGVAEYQNPGSDPYRIFINEDTIRSMGPTFAGRPVFVMHVDGVDDNVNELRKEADGWVVESFYNQADGKHWVKFIVVSDKGLRAIKNGMRLSNCYEPRGPFGDGGQWNGVSYAKEVKAGEYEHLAIVPNPRYEESVIMTPDEFKHYNETKTLELKRFANSNEDSKPMKFKFFKREKIENSIDLEAMSVVLPKSGKEVTLTALVEEADERFSNSPMAAHPEHLVDMGDGAKMTVNDLVTKHKAMCDELEAMKAKNTDSPDESGDPGHGEVEMESADVMNEDDDKEKEEKEKEEKKENEKKENDDDEKAKELADKAEKKKNDKARADAFRNAHKNAEPEARVELMQDQITRGRSRYGS